MAKGTHGPLDDGQTLATHPSWACARWIWAGPRSIIESRGRGLGDNPAERAMALLSMRLWTAS
jgi:hypothetical protein